MAINMKILTALHKIIKDIPKLVECYNKETGATETEESIANAINPKKPSGPIKFQDLLPLYCEAIADMKRLKDTPDKIDEYIAKHVNNLKAFPL